ncbi:non-ribosomal peptide synthetase [Archangium sp.]|uniref:non-ribosomal peptide synthetase n=1 Tax=Archangium sp. TaxID=1872627 RepID=UPI002D38F4B2|nr:non-ribosomal peptide synthetase [Archangium sp.]HYO54690.1 amino acid adenylation domain-containing protein [Archangium sp.]
MSSPSSQEKRAELERLLREKARKATSRHRLSHGQRMMWFLNQLDPDSTAYHLGQAVKLSGVLEPEALRRALERLVRRHPMLRTTFTLGGAEPEQHVHLVGECLFVAEDASDWEPARLEARLLALIDQPYELERGPLLRVGLFQRSGDEHVLLLAMHHIVGEFWALLVLVLELTELYQAERQRRPALLPALTRDYTDFVQWQHTWLDSSEGQAHARYWEARLAQPPPVLELPVDHPRPGIQTYDGATCPFTLDAELTRRLREYARAEGATVYTVLLAAFAAQLSRYTGRKDLLIGTPFTGRTSAAWAQVIGYFDNPLPLRADLSEDPSFRELVGRMRRTVLDAFTHQSFPFPLIVERLQPERDASRPPLFNVMLVLRKSHLPQLQPLTAFSMGSASASLEWGDLTVTPYPLARHVASLDLSLVLAESGEQLLAYWEYNTRLFDLDTLKRFTGHLKVLLDEALRDPRQRLSRLPLLTRGERDEVERWNDTRQALPSERLLHQPFEDQVQHRPEAIALIAQGRTWSYGALDTQAEQLAGWLRARGATREQLVGIVMEKGWEQVVAVLGTLKSGAAYLPIDAHLPAERIHHLLEVGRVSLVLTQPGWEARLSWPAHIQRLVIDPASLAPLDSRRQAPLQQPGDLAYVLFTSGSTGAPKGVMIEHAAALNTLLDVNERFSVGPGDRILGVSSLSFDLSVQDIFGTLAAGATLVLPEARGVQDPAHWVELVRDERVTLWNSVPGLARLLVGHAEQRAPEALRSLRVALLSGDWIALDLPERLRRLAPGIRVTSLGGATEASVWSILYPVDRVEPGWKSIPYGRPMANQTLHVLDAALQPCPVGIVGELYIGGVGVARGYWADAERTAARFIRHPRTDERLYRTGDLGRRDRHGVIEFLGRMDTQVKIRGFRVEPGEVEHVLARHPGVERALVVARQDTEGGDKRLVAYVVPRGEGAPTTSELHQSLKGQLPDYLVPSQFVWLSTLPLTPNGKVDLAALPVPERTRPELSVRFRPPGTELEQRLASLWSRVLGITGVGVDDNFFELGGDSVLAIQVCLRAHEEGWALSPRQIFERPTLAELARGVEPLAAGAPVPAAPPVTDGGTYPLSPMQHTLFLHGLCAPDRAAYSVQVFCPLSGPLEPERFERAWEQVLARHPNLRARFLLPEGGRKPVQVFQPGLTVPWQGLDWSAETAAEQEAHLRDWLREERARGFLPTDEHLLRPTLIRTGDERWMLVLSHHHLLLDGWSLSPLLKDLWVAYEALGRGTLPAYDEALAFSEHLRAVETRDVRAAEGFWREELQGFSEPRALPLPRPEHGEPRGFEHAELEWELGEQETARLMEHARAAGLTLNTLVQGAWALILARDGGEREVLFGVTVSGRSTDTPGAGASVGLYINTLPLRVRVEDGALARTWLGALQRRQPGLHEHGWLSIPAIQRLSGLGDRERPFGLYESVLVFENYPLDPWLRSPERTIRAGEPRFSEQTNTPLTLYAFPGPRLSLRFTYDAARFEPSSIDLLARHLGLALRELSEGMERPLGELSLLDAGERRFLLDTWSQAHVPRSPEPLVPGLIEEQARRTPQHPAVESGAETLTYAGLLQRARGLASRLARLGVGPDVPVALCLEREPGLIVSMLGIWQAGGAYLPLDPASPRERLGALLADSGASLVVTRRALADRLPGSVRVLCLEDVGEEEDFTPVAGALEREAAAYIIYTSGSTGHPKGTVVSHDALAAFVASARALYGLGASDRILQFASPAFDASVEEIFPCLASGATLVLRDDEMARSLPTFLQACDRARLTVLDLPTAFWHELEGEKAPLPASTRLVIIGGEQARAALVHSWRTRPGARPRLVNTYGPTEATVIATACELSTEGEAVHRAAIGRPLPHVEAYVLDAWLRPVPVGIPGELYLGGPALARGYLHRPDLTAERFLPHPFSSRPGARLYQTGDRVRLLASGDLEFLGRRDEQVKIRGFRVEPGELESVLLRHPGVAEAAVVPLGDGRGGWRLAAFLVPRGERLELPVLRHFLEESLPHYMLPAFLEWRERLPRNAGGKVARHLLRPEPGGVAAPEEPPRNDLEARLLPLWREVLGVSALGLHDNFFEAGGDSILCIQLVSRMNRAGLAITPRQLFQHQSVAELARAVLSQGPDAEARDLEDARLDPAIVPLPRAHPREGSHVLLTGATGFLGTFLLGELLAKTRATVHCLVRASGPDAGRERLHAALVDKGLWEESWSARIVPVVGDLSRPRLGLTEEDFDALARCLQVILHNGAGVNMALPYARLRVPNVLGTQEVLRLASRGESVPVHFVSTLAVFDGQPPSGDLHLEDTRPALETLPVMGYARSKGVAEALVSSAQERGLPVSIYRPATIIGHRQTGASHETDFLTILLRACIEARCMPGMDTLLHLVPVDFVSAAIVELAVRQAVTGGRFHLTPFRPTPLRTLTGWLRSFGFVLSELPYEEWRAVLRERALRSPEDPLGALLSLLPETWEPPLLQPRFDQRRTRAQLADTNVRGAEVDEELFHRQLEQLCRRGVFPRPGPPATTNQEMARAAAADQ